MLSGGKIPSCGVTVNDNGTARLAGTPPYTKEPRTHDWQSRPSQRDDHGDSAPVTRTSTAALRTHPAVRKHGHGVSTPELVNFMDNLHNRMIERVKGIGQQQYGGRVQKFETYGPDRLVSETLDELADVLAYVGMLTIKLLSAVKEQ